jgi:hypothetical protein
MPKRLRCLLRGHDWPEWQPWILAGNTTRYRQRWCNQCGKHELRIER